MNKTCARCEKTVYPTEELKCLDKVWHKGCFKCQECGMTLNMRTYKGYGKLPYCESHVPKAKHTTMAETPELKRIAENTKIQSNVKYHADFERSKGKFTQVADDPETLRIKANTKIISNVAYHGDLEKKAHMERQRQMNENGELVDVPTPDNYHQQIDNYATEMLPPNVPPPNLPTKNHYQAPTQYQNRQTQYKTEQPVYKTEQPVYKTEQPVYKTEQPVYKTEQPMYKTEQPMYKTEQPVYKTEQPVYKTEQPMYKTEQPVYKTEQPMYKTEQPVYKSEQPIYKTDQYKSESQQQFPPDQQFYRQEYYNQYQKYEEFNQNQYPNQNYVYGQYQQPNYGVGSQQKIGRIQDYDPLSDGPRVAPNTQRASATLIYNSTSDGKQRGAHQSQQQSRQIGRVQDLDPLAGEPPAARAQHSQPPANHHAKTQSNQRVYIAMYDYEANDSDEVSFREGDLISNVSSIDEGWMTGQVLRTGRTGMLPANYVDLAPAGVMPHH